MGMIGWIYVSWRLITQAEDGHKQGEHLREMDDKQWRSRWYRIMNGMNRRPAASLGSILYDFMTGLFNDCTASSFGLTASSKGSLQTYFLPFLVNYFQDDTIPVTSKVLVINKN